MSLLKLSPSFMDYIWGGHRLVDEYNKVYDKDVLAESWELSAHPDAPCVVCASSKEPDAGGITLPQYIHRYGKHEVLGSACDRFSDFPVLIKLIDAAKNLSIQVHPSDEYALKNEGQYGKTEMWYIVDAAEDAFIYYGFKKRITKEEFEKRIEDNTLEEALNKVMVHPGEIYFIPSGTLHAIGAGCLIAEIQQNSNVTYRVYDYGRLGNDGKPRELNIDKALDVTTLGPVEDLPKMGEHLGKCGYFTTDLVMIDGHEISQVADARSFKHLMFLGGEGEIIYRGRTYHYQNGDSFMFTAGSGDFKVRGFGKAIMTYEE